MNIPQSFFTEMNKIAAPIPGTFLHSVGKFLSPGKAFLQKETATVADDAAKKISQASDQLNPMRNRFANMQKQEGHIQNRINTVQGKITDAPTQGFWNHMNQKSLERNQNRLVQHQAEMNSYHQGLQDKENELSQRVGHINHMADRKNQINGMKAKRMNFHRRFGVGVASAATVGGGALFLNGQQQSQPQYQQPYQG